MSNVQDRSNWGLFALGVTVGLALVISTCVISRTFRSIKSENQGLEVSGFSQKMITSDKGVWAISVISRAQTLAESSDHLNQARAKVFSFAAAKGVTTQSLEVEPAVMNIVMDRDKEDTVVGYRMTQQISLSSSDVALVAKVAESSSDLAGLGVEYSSEPPNYYYTKMDDIKIEMLAQAASNARLRAEKLAEENKSSVGPLRYVHQGVFQITSPYSNEVTDNGVNDIRSKEKLIKAIVTVRYAIGE